MMNKKYLLLFFSLFVLCINKAAFAQPLSDGVADLSMTQRLEALRDGIIPPSVLASDIAASASIPLTEAQDLVDNIAGNATANLIQAGELLDRVSQGIIPADFAIEIADIPGLGDLTSLTDLSGILSSSAVTDLLDNALDAAGITGFNDALSNIAGVFGGAEALSLLQTEAENIANILNDANGALSGVFGSLTNLENGLDLLGANFMEQLSNTQIIEALQTGFISDALASIQLAANMDEALADVQDFLSGLDLGAIDIGQIGQLVEQVAEGIIPGEIASLVANLPDLGAITDIADIANVFENVDFAAAISDILSADGIEAARQALAGVVSSLGGVEALLNSATAAGAAALATALENIDPSIIAAFGGIDALVGGLTGAIGDVLAGGIIPGIGGSCNKSKCSDDSDPNPPAPGKSCGTACIGTCFCKVAIQNNHKSIRKFVSDQFDAHRQWFVDVLIKENVLPAFARMATQFSVISMQQTEIIGRFFDAKHQLETQRLLQTMAARVYREMMPSPGLCVFGTLKQSLVTSREGANLERDVLSQRALDRFLRSGDVISSAGDESDKISRRDHFIETYCNKDDNGNGLNLLCKNSTPDRERINNDIDYVGTFDMPLTLDIDFSAAESGNVTPTETDIFALSSNIYAHNVMPISADLTLADGNGIPRQKAYAFTNHRTVAAPKTAAYGTFSTIAGLKSSGDPTAAKYLRNVHQNLGMLDTEMDAELGEEPSYYLQLKTISYDHYRRNSFFIDLLESEENVIRKGTSISGLSLILDREIYESVLRSQTIDALILEAMLKKEEDAVREKIETITRTDRPIDR